MLSDFKNRIDAQRELLKIVNEHPWPNEQLLSLSEGAIQRWIIANQLPRTSELVVEVFKAAAALYFLANRSQEQITDEYAANSAEFAGCLRHVQTAIARIRQQ